MSAEPLRTITFTLKPANAWDYESRPRPFTRWGRIAFILWLMLAGAVAALLPDTITGGRDNWGFWAIAGVLVAIQYVLASLVMTLAIFMRARRRIPTPREIRLEEWSDHFAITEPGHSRSIAFTAIDKMLLTPAGLTLAAGADLLIIPRRGLPKVQELEALAAFLNAYGKDRLAGVLPDLAPSEPLPAPVDPKTPTP